MGVVVVVPRSVESLSVPRCEVVPFLIAGAGDVIWTRPGRFPAAPEPYTAAVSLVCAGGVVAAVVVVVTAAAGQTVETRHRLLCSAIVVQLKRLTDFCHKSVHFFRVDGHGLLQKDVVFLSTRHFQAESSTFKHNSVEIKPGTLLRHPQPPRCPEKSSR